MLSLDEYQVFASKFSDPELEQRQKYQMLFSLKPRGKMIIDAFDDIEGRYGRFANYGRDFFHSNSKSCARLLRNVGKSKSLKPVVLLVATKLIKTGSQVLYDYGDSYFDAGGVELEWGKIEFCLCDRKACKKRRIDKKIGKKVEKKEEKK